MDLALLRWPVFGILLVSGGKGKADTQTGILLKPFIRWRMYLYKRLYGFFPRLFSSGPVEKDLRQLHRGARRVCETVYYVKKEATVWRWYLQGRFLARQRNSARRAGQFGRMVGSLSETHYGKGKQTGRSDPGSNGEKQMDFRWNSGNRCCCQGRGEKRLWTICRKAASIIWPEKESLQKVTGDLRLQEKYDGFPDCDWTATNRDF